MEIKVIIPDEKKNDAMSKHMSMLEKTLDRQYKTFQDGKDYIKVIERMQKSFMDKLESIILASNSNRDIYEKRLDTIRKEFSNRINEFKSSDNSDELLKTFSRKLTSLESTIKNIPTQKTIVNKTVNPVVNLDKSFENMFNRLESAIMKVRPRVTPSPM
jgi:signal recognition particle GTPase